MVLSKDINYLRFVTVLLMFFSCSCLKKTDSEDMPQEKISDATLWNKFDKTNFGDASINWQVLTEDHAYVNAGNTLFFSPDGINFQAVDFTTGHEVGAPTIKAVLDIKEIGLMQALSKNRIIFVGIKKDNADPLNPKAGLAIAENGKVTDVWTEGAGSQFSAADITGLAVTHGSENKEVIALTLRSKPRNDRDKDIYFQFDSTKLKTLWLSTVHDSEGKAPISDFPVGIWPGPKNEGLYLMKRDANNNKIIMSKIEKDQLKDGGKATHKRDEGSVEIEKDIGFAFFDDGSYISFYPNGDKAERMIIKKPGNPDKKITIPNLINRDDVYGFDIGPQIKLFTNQGILYVKSDGTLDTSKTFKGDLRGHNYAYKTANEFALLKKADLKPYSLGMPEITFEAQSENLHAFITWNGQLFIGRRHQNIVLKK